MALTKKEVKRQTEEALKVLEKMADATDTKYMILASNKVTDKVTAIFNGQGTDLVDILLTLMHESEEFKSFLLLAIKGYLLNKTSKTLLDDMLQYKNEEETEEDETDEETPEDDIINRLQRINEMAKDALKAANQLQDIIKSRI